MTKMRVIVAAYCGEYAAFRSIQALIDFLQPLADCEEFKLEDLTLETGDVPALQCSQLLSTHNPSLN